MKNGIFYLSPPASSMPCQARILDKKFKIPGTSEWCHTTKECGGATDKKITVDDGDAQMTICPACLKRFLTKCSDKSKWYGWFDGEYPPEARVKYSRLYYDILDVEVKGRVQVVEEEAEEAAEEAEEAEEEVQEAEVAEEEADAEVAELTQAVASLSLKDSLEARLAEIKIWQTTQGKAASIKEQRAISKERMDITTRLRLI